MIDVLLARVWAPPPLCPLQYIFDYALTIAAARLYQSRNKTVFEGSYEITPTCQTDVNALRRLSLRFLFMLTLTTAYVTLLSVLTRPWAGASWWYLFLLGSVVLFGGALSCAATSVAHYRVAWRHDSQRAQAAGKA
jgi:hypothetical protein